MFFVWGCKQTASIRHKRRSLIVHSLSADKDASLDSPRKRSKSTPRKSSSSPGASSKSNSPLIAKPKLQINDKTLKKLRTDTDDLIFEDASNATESPAVGHQSSRDSPTTKLKAAANNCLMPVVNNVLSRSIAAILKNSPIAKNGEFVNSYSALGFNKGPRVKRVCRSSIDGYRGAPRAVFPLPTSQSKTAKAAKTPSANSSPSKQRAGKSGKKLLKTQSSSASSSAAQSASTSKSNSNSSFKEDDSTTECSYDCDSDDLEITDYIARNLKREMESKDISV